MAKPPLVHAYERFCHCLSLPFTASRCFGTLLTQAQAEPTGCFKPRDPRLAAAAPAAAAAAVEGVEAEEELVIDDPAMPAPAAAAPADAAAAPQEQQRQQQQEQQEQQEQQPMQEDHPAAAAAGDPGTAGRRASTRQRLATNYFESGVESYDDLESDNEEDAAVVDIPPVPLSGWRRIRNSNWLSHGSAVALLCTGDLLLVCMRCFSALLSSMSAWELSPHVCFLLQDPTWSNKHPSRLACWPSFLCLRKSR